MVRTAVVGVGNILMGDEGAGVEVAARVLEKRERLQEIEIEVLDAGTAFFMIAPDLHRFDRLVIVDAVRAGGAPGSVYRFLPEDVEARDAGISLHDMGVMEALRLERLAGSLTDNVVLYGIEPMRVELGIGLSEPVRHVIDKVADRILEELLQTSSV